MKYIYYYVDLKMGNDDYCIVSNYGELHFTPTSAGQPSFIGIKLH